MIWSNDMPNLRSLVLNASDESPYSYVLWIDRVLPRIPHIRHLVLRFWRMLASTLAGAAATMNLTELKDLEVLDVRNSDLGQVWTIPSWLRKLDFSNCIGYGLDVKTGDFSKLTHLSMSKAASCIGYSNFRSILYGNRGALKHLNAEGWAVDNSWWREIIFAGYFSNLEDLNLNDCRLDDRIATLLARKINRLQTLSLANNEITGVGISAFVKSTPDDTLPILQYLCLDHCHQCSLDAVDWVRSKGVKVSFSFAVPPLKGLRLRGG